MTDEQMDELAKLIASWLPDIKTFDGKPIVFDWKADFERRVHWALAAALVAEGQDVADFTCPVCGQQGVHNHSQEELQSWVCAQAERVGLRLPKQWLLSKGNSNTSEKCASPSALAASENIRAAALVAEEPSPDYDDTDIEVLKRRIRTLEGNLKDINLLYIKALGGQQ